MKLDSDIFTLIDAWHICPYADKVDELFECLRHCAEAYITKGILDTSTIISVVKDMRDYLNPTGNANLFYFTDIICDAILLKFEGIDGGGIPDFIEFTRECELYVFVKG